MVLEKTLESPLDYKMIQPVHPKGDQSWLFIGRNDAKAEAPVLWPPQAKSWGFQFCWHIECCIFTASSFSIWNSSAGIPSPPLAPQPTILPFCISFSWYWFWSLPPIQCHKHLSIVLQALCLSDLFPWIYLSLPLYNCKGFDVGHTWMV